MREPLSISMKKFITFRTIWSKLIVTFFLFAMAMIFAMNMVVTSTLSNFQQNLISDRLSADINYIEDLISLNMDAHWNVKEDSIYFGDILIGDGSEEKANFEPFLDHERKTGTLAYVFMLDKDAKLGYVESKENSIGYQEGRYIRVAGSTKGPNGESIVGTYMTKNVADALDKNGIYAGEANVSGGLIYCLYKTLSNEKDEVVGAIVVGRYIGELKRQVENSVNRVSMFMVGIMSVCLLFIIIFMGRWLSAITMITGYLKQIEEGSIPEHSLSLDTKDEISTIGESINRMVLSLKENIILRKKSETDALTGLPNRFAYDHYSKYIYNYLRKNPQTLAVEILDIDYFKQYNDNYGHQAGDKCVEIVAREIQAMILGQQNIFACRYGGDEFVIIYNGYLKEEVENFALRLKTRIANCNIEHKYSLVSNIVTLTQGICFDIFEPNYTIKDFLEKADEALYQVKNESRNAYKIVEI